MSLKFIQMADPQFGMFASISQLSEEDARSRSREGMNLRYVEDEFNHYEPEIKLFTKAIAQANEYKPDFVVMCEYVSTGPVGYPLGEDPSGIRVVNLDYGYLRHQYISLE